MYIITNWINHKSDQNDNQGHQSIILLNISKNKLFTKYIIYIFKNI